MEVPEVKYKLYYIYKCFAEHYEVIPNPLAASPASLAPFVLGDVIAAVY